MIRLNRRGFLLAAGTAATVSAPIPGLAFTDQAVVPVHLTVAQLEQPLGIDDRQPTFGWQLQSSRPGARQMSYRVRVASSLALLTEGRPDLWDSGRVESSATLGIVYGGKPLASRQRCYWSVQCWDEQGRASAPAASSWEMGLLAADDWQAQWLAVENEVQRDDRDAGMEWVSAPATQERSRFFRLPFTLTEPANVLVTLPADGMVEAVRVDASSLTLPFHHPNAFGGAPASRWELELSAGEHELVVQIRPAPGFAAKPYAAVAAQLRATYASGATERFSRGWQTRSGNKGEPWLPAEVMRPQPVTPWPPEPARLFRTEFGVRHGVRRARLYATALGAYELHLNGRKVGDAVLQTESVDFSKRTLYRTFDVTEQLRRGRNALGVMVGDGWYGSYMAPWQRFAFGPAPVRFLCQLEVEYDDGSRDVIGSEPSWRSAWAPILRAELYNGEIYDARLEQDGWATPAFDDHHWGDSWLAAAPAVTLTAHIVPPIRPVRELAPSAITEPEPGVYIVDFGQNFSGWVRLTLAEKAGTTITLRYAELLGADGLVDQENLRAAEATDTYIARGDAGAERYEPRFTYHGFRYVQIEGLASAPTAETVVGVVLHNDLRETGLLRISDPIIQGLWQNTLWSQRSNFFAIPTDCPQRDERLGWTGDAQVFWDAAAFNMDVAVFTRKFMTDLRDAQTEQGAFPLWAPVGGSGKAWGQETPTPAWADAGVMLPYVTWRRYGDLTIVRENWHAMNAYLEGILRNNPNYLWREGRGTNLGDWLSLDAKQPFDETTPKDLLATAMLIRSIDQVAEMAAALDKQSAAAEWREHARRARTAFQRAFVNADGAVGNGSHTSYILAIACRLLDGSTRQAAGQKLVADIRRRGTLLSTGFVGTPLSLDAIADIGEIELVYDLLLRREFPSWGYMVAKGATTIWERWNGDTGDVSMNSFNHYALGAVIGFVYRRIGGLDPVAPGFAKVKVEPLLDPRISHCEVTYQSASGPWRVAWHRTAGRFELELDVPANTEAVIHLPVSDTARVLEAGRAVTFDAQQVARQRAHDPRLIVLKSAGSHRWQIDGL